MSETIAGKAGGTSNATAAATIQSLAWAEQCDVFAVSAPGEVKDKDGTVLAPKVTDLLLDAREYFEVHGEAPRTISDEITGRYRDIVHGLGISSLRYRWVNAIPARFGEAVRTSEDTASMFGERLQAEIYEAQGFTLLDPSRAPHDLGDDPDAWRAWLSSVFRKGNRYVLPGNTTKVNGQSVTFDRGGSDITDGLAAYGIQADLNLNLTDNPALTASPKLVERKHLSRIPHLLYVEGRELGRNGTGLVHPAAMVPLMRGNIPTEVQNTFDPNEEPTRLDNDEARAASRRGRVMALSLMEGVVIHRVHEPGMAEATGRLAAFDEALAIGKVPVVDSQGDGVDGQKYFVEAKYAEKAREALEKATRYGHVDSTGNVDLITMVGFELAKRRFDNIVDLIFNSGTRFDAKHWQHQGHDMSQGRHSLRISVDQADSKEILNQLHEHFIEIPTERREAIKKS